MSPSGTITYRDGRDDDDGKIPNYEFFLDGIRLNSSVVSLTENYKKIELKGNDENNFGENTMIVHGNDTLPSKIIRIKVIVAKNRTKDNNQILNGDFSSSTIQVQQVIVDDISTNDGKIIEELVLEKYKHILIYYKERSVRRSKIWKTISRTISKIDENKRESSTNDDENNREDSQEILEISSNDSSHHLKNSTNDRRDSSSPLTSPIQDRIIFQIHKLIEISKKKKDGDVYVESHRLLLLANKYSDLEKNISLSPKSSLCSRHGIVTIWNVSLRTIPISHDPNYFYVCLLSCGRLVLSSTPVRSDYPEGFLNFDGEFRFHHLLSLFTIHAHVYVIRLPKYLTSQSASNKKSVSKFVARKLSFRHQKDKVKSKLESSFVLVGKFDLKVDNVNNREEFLIRNVGPEVVHFDRGTVRMECEIEEDFRPKHYSFVNVGIKVKSHPINWSRLWGCIGRIDLQFWKYPEDDPECPVLSVQLKNCTYVQIDDYYNKSKTLQLEILRVDENGEEKTLYFLSFDSHQEMNDWHSTLNSLLPFLKRIL